MDTVDNSSRLYQVKGTPFEGRLAAIFRPPERLSVTRWCEKHRILNRKYSNIIGSYRVAVTPWLREPLDAFALPEVRSIVLVSAAQIGKTTFGDNCLGFSADEYPMPALYVRPTEDELKEQFKGRFRSLFSDSPRLASHRPAHGWFKDHLIQLDKMVIYGSWTSAPNTLTGRSCGIVYFDEVDNCDSPAGRLGNHWSLAKRRITTFRHRAKMIGTGTPTTVDGTLWQEYESSDGRQYWVPCPLCGHYQLLVFDQIKIPEAIRNPKQIREEKCAVYQCIECRGSIPENRIHWMATRGIWVPKGAEILDKLDVEDKEMVAAADTTQDERWQPRLAKLPKYTSERGYWINGIYASYLGVTLSSIMAEFLEVKNAPESLRVFKNAVLAEPWAQSVLSTSAGMLYEKSASSDSEARIVPPGAKIILVGVDVQADTLFYVVRAWGPYETSWLVQYGVLDRFETLYDLCFQQGWQMAEDPSRRMKAYAMLVDSGYRTDEVYEWSRLGGVAASKGWEDTVYRTRKATVAGKIIKQELVLWHVNTSIFKNMLHRKIRVPEGHQGSWNLHRDVSDEYVNHLSSEHQVMDRPPKSRRDRKRFVWRLKREGLANHYLDCEVYGLALVDVLEQEGEISVPGLRENDHKVGVIGASVAVGRRRGRRNKQDGPKNKFPSGRQWPIRSM